MEHYVWDDYKGKIADDKDLKQRPKDRSKDFPDLIRYGLMSDPVTELPANFKALNNYLCKIREAKNGNG